MAYARIKSGGGGAGSATSRHQSSDSGTPSWTGGKGSPQTGPAGTVLGQLQGPVLGAAGRAPAGAPGAKAGGPPGAGLGPRGRGSQEALAGQGGRVVGRGAPGLEQEGPRRSVPRLQPQRPRGGQAGGRRGGHSGRPWPSRRPVSGTLSAAPLSSWPETSPRGRQLAGGEGSRQCRAQQQAFMEALRPGR